MNKDEEEEPESVAEWKERTGQRASTRIKKDILLRCLEASLCVISTACKKAGIERKTYYNWMDSDDEFVKDVNLLRETIADFVETQLYSQIKANNSRSTIFFLKTRCKDRGYVEDTNINLNAENGAQVIFSLPLNDRDKETRK